MYHCDAPLKMYRSFQKGVKQVQKILTFLFIFRILLIWIAGKPDLTITTSGEEGSADGHCRWGRRFDKRNYCQWRLGKCRPNSECARGHNGAGRRGRWWSRRPRRGFAQSLSQASLLIFMLDCYGAQKLEDGLAPGKRNIQLYDVSTTMQQQKTDHDNAVIV